MAKYLDTSHISSELMELLKEAKERIILVTYSIQVNTQIQERLKTKSKLGTLGEITLIYGNTKPKQSELQWMKEIDDLKVFQKKNLHAKCYINEKKAIICSMNLYDYSQTSNVEMGFLITKDEDSEAYAKMMEDINDLRINGERVKPWEESDSAEEVKKVEVQTRILDTKSKSKLTYNQQIKKQILQFFRNDMSTQYKQKSELILSNKEIEDIISIENLTKVHLKKILDSDKKVKQIGDKLLYELENTEGYVIGQVTDTRYQSNEFTYDQVRLVRMDDGTEQWYDTKKELPKKNSFVAVHLNQNWFNKYLILEESEMIYETNVKNGRSFTNSALMSSKDLAYKTGLSSRDINSTLVSMGLMVKQNNEWLTTPKGEKLGAFQMEGQYGKFVVWPEEIINIMQL